MLLVLVKFEFYSNDSLNFLGESSCGATNIISDNISLKYSTEPNKVLEERKKNRKIDLRNSKFVQVELFIFNRLLTSHMIKNHFSAHSPKHHETKKLSTKKKYKGLRVKINVFTHFSSMA